MIVFHKYLQVDYVSVNVSFDLPIINIFKTHDDIYIWLCSCARWKAKCIDRKLTSLGKYSLNVNILKWFWTLIYGQNMFKT